MPTLVNLLYLIAGLTLAVVMDVACSRIMPRLEKTATTKKIVVIKHK